MGYIFFDYFENSKSAQARLTGIIDGLIAAALLIVGFVHFNDKDYPKAFLFFFLVIPFQLNSLYYLIIAKLEDIQQELH